MLTTNDIPTIESRIRAAGMTMDDFCRTAGIDRATWQRWKAKMNRPNWATWERVVTAVEDIPELSGDDQQERVA